MRVYNTLSGEKEDLVPGNPPEIKMYVCGPTTYNYIHLGNARPLVVFDTVRRYLEYRGYHVTYVQNFTDVDDKIIKRAQEEGIDPLVLAQKYIEEYFIDADRLGIRRADVHPRVSEHMPQIITAVAGLIENKHAYPVDGDVYYRINAFSSYGKLSGRALDDMLAGARVGVDERKEDPMDFALWKAAKPGEPSWDSPWGPGRPGWHIECSVMSTFYLGNTLDIHGGGADLIFPHHENEIAQAEGLTGEPFCRYWLHNGFITINNEKMSKSLGNFFILRDILDKYPADVVRFYLIATHYRSPLDFDDGKLEEARKALGRLKTTRILAQEFLQGIAVETGSANDALAADFLDEIRSLEKQFIEAMDDDFNSAKAIGYLFEMARSINSFLVSGNSNNSTHQSVLIQVLAIYEALAEVMGLFQHQNEAGMEIENILQVISTLRARARQNKEFSLADQIRDFMQSLGIKLEDTEGGCRFRYEEAPVIQDLLQECIRLRAQLKELKNYRDADFIREELLKAGIILEDTREGVRWKFA